MLRRTLATACAGLFLFTTTTGCFGTFPTVRNVYHWNATVHPDKWVRWLVFLGLSIIPVYGFVALLDAIFSNSVEFWTGKNPLAMAPGTTREVEGPNGERATLTLREDGAIDVVVRAPGQPDERFSLVRDVDSVSAYDEKGVLLGRVGDGPDGQPALLSGALAH